MNAPSANRTTAAPTAHPCTGRKAPANTTTIAVNKALTSMMVTLGTMFSLHRIIDTPLAPSWHAHATVRLVDPSCSMYGRAWVSAMHS